MTGRRHPQTQPQPLPLPLPQRQPQPGALRSLLMAVLLLAVMLWAGLVCLAWCGLAMVLAPLLPARRGQALGRWAIATIFRMVWAMAVGAGLLRLDAAALNALRDEHGLIIVANHPSMMDALILVAHLPRSACIMKASLLRNVFLGGGARLARYVSNQSPLGMVRRAVQVLKEGGQLVMFPEGTRTTLAPLNPFDHSVSLIAKHAGAPIQTAFIDTDSPYLGKGWPLWKLPPLPVVINIRLGERFAPQADADALLRQIEAYYRAGVKPHRAAAGAPPAG